MSGPIDHYEIRWRPSDSDGEWSYITAPADATTVTISKVDRAKAYVIQARSVGPTNLKSIWVDITHTVADNNPPEAPSSPTATGVADAVKLTCAFIYPMEADVDICVERSTAFAGPFVEVMRARTTTIIVPETVDGMLYYRLRTRNFKGQYSVYSATVNARPAVVNTSLDTRILNPNFEQGLNQWIASPEFYVDDGVNSLTGNMAVHPPGVASSGRIQNAKVFPVKAGQEWVVNGAMNAVSSPDGSATIGVMFWNNAGTLLGERYVSYAQSPAIASLTWHSGSKRLVVPLGATRASVTGVVSGHTVGYWCFDSFQIDKVSDFVPGTLSGENLIPNHNFSQNVGEWPTNKADLRVGDPLTDGWLVDSNTLATLWPSATTSGLEVNDTDSGLRMAFIGDTTLTGSTLANGSGGIWILTYSKFSVNSLQKFFIEYDGRVDTSASRPSGVNYTVYMGVRFYDRDNNFISFAGFSGLNTTGGFTSSTVVTVPANSAYARGAIGLDVSNTSGASVATAWAMCHCRFRSIKVRRVSNLDEGTIADGTVYGRTANTDLTVDSGVRRIGLNVRGSRKILGGARNSRASIVAGVSSVRSATALSANSSGQVSVNAHTVDVSGETVTYNAVANAISGLTQSVTYVVYTFDPYLDGGTRTYYAQTSVLSAQQSGEGAVIMGYITIPTSGSSSGGSPGTGNPGGYCLDIDTALPDGRLLRQLSLDDMVECIDVVTGEVRLFPLISMKFGVEECYRIVTPNGCSVIQSKSTPMDLPDGSVKLTTEMMGQFVWSKSDGIVHRSHVCDIQYVGLRPVIKPNLGGRMLFAGERASACIATHNSDYKP